MRLRKRLVGFIAVIQFILFLTHYLLYETWTFSPGGVAPAGGLWVKIALGALSVSFVAASLLAFQFNNPMVRAFYRLAAVWLGIMSFLVLAAVGSWIILAVTSLAGLRLPFHEIVAILFGFGLLAGVYGVVNANWTRLTRITVRLPNLPESWRGKTAALISDLHLGHVRNGGFLRRMIARILREAPDAVFITGDLYDGTAIDADRAARPLAHLKAPHGVYFVAGNHEQFGDDHKYLDAVAAAGVRVLKNEQVDLDGLQVVGVPYRDAVWKAPFASVLKRFRVDRNRASILLTHAPDHPEIAEAAGFSLQLSGHTHLGQFIPFSWIVRRIYGPFAYGLSRIGGMQVFTSSGAGTWGPPLRLGSNPEIVLLEFE
jgi:predicted MPP superfamily phosphohydrolase